MVQIVWLLPTVAVLGAAPTVIVTLLVLEEHVPLLIVQRNT